MAVRKNIVFIVVDCLRADHLSTYGYENSTPNIEALAEKSDVYLKAKAAGSQTIRSLPFILSEYLYITLTKRGYKYPTVVHSSPVVDRYLKTSGVPWFNIDTFKRITRKYPGSRTVDDFIRKLRTSIDAVFGTSFEDHIRAPGINRVAQTVLTMLRPPFFLCIWYMDVHTPLLPPGRTKISDLNLNRRHLKTINRRDSLTEEHRERLIELYDEEISLFDENLGHILKQIPENSIVIFTADHGDEFGEDGDYGHHVKDIDALTWVPFFVHVPGREPRELGDFDFKQFDKFVEELIF